MSRFDRTPYATPQGSHRDNQMGQRPGVVARNTLFLTYWPGRIREDQSVAFPGRTTWDQIEGVTWSIDSGGIVDGGDRGQVQGHPYAPDGKGTVLMVDPPGAPTAPGSGLRKNVGTQTGTGVWTWEGWIRLGGASRGVVCELQSTAGGDHSVNLTISESSGVTLDMQNNTPTEVLNTLAVAANFPWDMWHHFAVTKNGTSWEMFWDGKSVASGTGVTEGDIDTMLYTGQTPNKNYWGPQRLSSVVRYTEDFEPLKVARQWTID